VGQVHHHDKASHRPSQLLWEFLCCAVSEVHSSTLRKRKKNQRMTFRNAMWLRYRNHSILQLGHVPGIIAFANTSSQVGPCSVHESEISLQGRPVAHFNTRRNSKKATRRTNSMTLRSTSLVGGNRGDGRGARRFVSRTWGTSAITTFVLSKWGRSG
jgi:hypothetical protein